MTESQRKAKSKRYLALKAKLKVLYKQEDDSDKELDRMIRMGSKHLRKHEKLRVKIYETEVALDNLELKLDY